MNRPTPSSHDADLARIIDDEAVDENESRATKELYEALMEHRSTLSGGGKVSDRDDAFSESLQREASRRSAEITAYRRNSSTLTPVDGKPLAPWVLIGWIVAIVATAVAFWWILSP